MAESLVGQALSAMHPVSVNFSDVNQLAAQQSQAISNIGNIFDKMDQRKLEEQKLEQNLMLERAKLLEQARQFGIKSQLDWDTVVANNQSALDRQKLHTQGLKDVANINNTALLQRQKMMDEAAYNRQILINDAAYQRQKMMDEAAYNRQLLANQGQMDLKRFESDKQDMLRDKEAKARQETIDIITGKKLGELNTLKEQEVQANPATKLINIGSENLTKSIEDAQKRLLNTRAQIAQLTPTENEQKEVNNLLQRRQKQFSMLPSGEAYDPNEVKRIDEQLSKVAPGKIFFDKNGNIALYNLPSNNMYQDERGYWHGVAEAENKENNFTTQDIQPVLDRWKYLKEQEAKIQNELNNYQQSQKDLNAWRREIRGDIDKKYESQEKEVDPESMIVYKKDDKGNIVLDENGNPIQEKIPNFAKRVEILNRELAKQGIPYNPDMDTNWLMLQQAQKAQDDLRTAQAKQDAELKQWAAEQKMKQEFENNKTNVYTRILNNIKATSGDQELTFDNKQITELNDLVSDIYDISKMNNIKVNHASIADMLSSSIMERNWEMIGKNKVDFKDRAKLERLKDVLKRVKNGDIQLNENTVDQIIIKYGLSSNEKAVLKKLIK